jgi:replicative DNA helicase
MGDVHVGDELIGADGRPTKVVATTPVLYGRPCYEVEFNDGTVIVADAAHQWLTETRAARKSAYAAAMDSRHRNQRVFPSVKTTEEIARTLRCDTADKRLNHAVAVAGPLSLPESDLPLPPYALGVWLGDGHSASARFTTADPEIIQYLEVEGLRVVPNVFSPHELHSEVAGAPTHRGIPAPPPTCPDCGERSSGCSQCQKCRDRHGTVKAILRKLGVLGNKHIPPQYLRASEAQRRALLAGLLDTDGYVNKTGTVQFAVTDQRLAYDTLELILSLGYKATMTTKRAKGKRPETSICYQVTFTPSDKVFWLTRKAARQTTREYPTTVRRYITDVRPMPSVPVRCVEVDNADHLYLASRAWIPTHNSTLALDLARAAAIRNQLATVVFSLEMSRNEITMRLLSAEARVALHSMRSGSMNDEDWTRLARRMSEVAEAPLFIDDSPNMSMMEIRAKCRRLKQQHDLRMVIVDYLQLMSSGKRVESRQVEVSEFSRSLKLLAKELEVPVIALSQLNRGPEQRTDKKPMVSDLRESGSIEQDADVVILLHREDAYEKESPRAGEADLIVAKHRNGPTATVTVAFQGHYSRFVDMAQ